MMLPLSTIEGQETEEVQTRPPEKGVLLSVKADVPRKKSKRMKGTVSFRVLPFCPVVPWTSSEPALPGPPGQAVSKPARSSPDAQTEPGAGGQSRGRSSEGSAPAGRGAREGAAGSPRGGRGRPGRRCGRALGCCLGAPRPQRVARCGPCRNPGSPEGGGRPQTLVSRGATRVRGFFWPLGGGEPGGNTGGWGVRRQGPLQGRRRGARVLVPRLCGREGRTRDFAVCWRRREAQVCSAHQRGQSVSGSADSTRG
uniref:Uncharacterized protein n=1 Tax=Ovis aries TaxID=9940 RepID=A0AC11DMS9_SHEEP